MDDITLAKIEEKRKENKVKWENVERDPKKEYKLICPACDKPNTLSVDFCTGCKFDLSPWDLKEMPANIFANLIAGEDTGTHVLCRTNEYLVFDDKFGVSKHHIDVIPTQVIENITFLTAEHLPMLKTLYRVGLEELKSRNEEMFKNISNLEDCLIAGYNFPVSVKHLHLHMVLPPFSHEKVFQYPRFHPHSKIINDLEKFGKVHTYEEYPNEKEGNDYYDRVIKLHRHYNKNEE